MAEPEPKFQENHNISDNIGSVFSTTFDQELPQDLECRIIRQSLKNLHKKLGRIEKHPFENSVFNFKNSAPNREEYTHIHQNENTASTSHMTSEYRAGAKGLQRSKFAYKSQQSQSKIQNQGYSVINP